MIRPVWIYNFLVAAIFAVAVVVVVVVFTVNYNIW